MLLASYPLYRVAQGKFSFGLKRMRKSRLGSNRDLGLIDILFEISSELPTVWDLGLCAIIGREPTGSGMALQ